MTAVPSVCPAAAEEITERKFAVRVGDLRPREIVFVTGSVAELGEWKHERMLPLAPEGGSLWAVTVELPTGAEVLFRYCIGVKFEGDEAGRPPLVRLCETDIHPRRLGYEDEEHTFGVYGGHNRVCRGWLTSDTLVQFKLFDNPLKLKSRLEGRKVNIKVTPVTLSLGVEGACTAEEASVSADASDAEGGLAGVYVEVATLNDKQCGPEPQGQFGHTYSAGDTMVVSVWAPSIDGVAYLLDVYAWATCASPDDAPHHAGYAYVLPDMLRRSEGRLELPVVCGVRNRPLGSVQLEYLVVRPMSEPLCDLSVSYTKHWDPSWTGLEVGHRGLGASFKTKEGTEIRENTIASLKRAASSGADLLEFDVQLSRDMVPIIYHDFYVCISMRRKKQVDYTDMLELPVKDLSLDQLQKLKVYHLVEGRSNEIRFFDEELDEHQPFPTLATVLQAIDHHVGFNIELKWTMELSDGTFELNNPFDMNTYVDKVLEVVLTHAEDRRIVFSCFHPDICTMVRYKQNKYPVMFLTQGVTERYPHYRDVRCASIQAAVRHAVSSDILGVVVHTEDLLRDPTQVKLATDAGLVIFCWGDDNNNRDTILRLKEMGLHAVIYDKLDQFTTKEVKESIFLVEARESQREVLCEAMLEARAALEQGSTSQETVSTDVSVPRASRAPPAPPPPPPRPINISTATSLASLAPPPPPAELIAGVDKELQHKSPAGSFAGLFPALPKEPQPDRPGDERRQRPGSASSQSKKICNDYVDREIKGTENMET